MPADGRRDRARRRDDLRRPAAGGDDPADLHRPLRLGLRQDRPGRLGRASRPARCRCSALDRVRAAPRGSRTRAPTSSRSSPWSARAGRVEDEGSSTPERGRASTRRASGLHRLATTAGRDDRGRARDPARGELGRGERDRGRRPDQRSPPRPGSIDAPGRRPLPVLERPRLRRRGLRRDAARDRAHGLRQARRLRRDRRRSSTARTRPRSTRSANASRREFGKGVEVATPAGQGRGDPAAAPGAQRRPLLLRRAWRCSSAAS